MVNIYEYLILAVVVALGNFGGAQQVNDMVDLPEDKYLPRKWKRLNILFLFLPKVGLIRWRAYWMHIVSQIGIAVYFIIMTLCLIVTGSCNFIHNPFFIVYIAVYACSRLFWEIGIYIYVKIKQLNTGD